MSSSKGLHPLDKVYHYFTKPNIIKEAHFDEVKNILSIKLENKNDVSIKVQKQMIDQAKELIELTKQK